MKSSPLRVLIDAREFIHGRLTGIGRVLEGLSDALSDSRIAEEIVLAATLIEAVPLKLRNRENIKTQSIPSSFLKSEKALSRLSKQDFSLFISPYPKLPLFGCQCDAVHTIHDVLDLTHPAYKRRFKVIFDRFRLKMALKKASLTWFDSSWSLEETKKYVGTVGRNPRVRFPGLDEKLKEKEQRMEEDVLKKYGLGPGYVLSVGNGLPHKNLGVLLEIADKISRQIVFAGVSRKNQQFWRSRYPGAKPIWIEHVSEEDMSTVMRGSFCLAQPSTAEGYGYPPLEAMACGVPAVVSQIPVLAETSGGNALFADPGDPQAWIAAFDALENKDVHQDQVEKGLRWVEPLLGREGWSKHLSDLKELLNK